MKGLREYNGSGQSIKATMLLFMLCGISAAAQCEELEQAISDSDRKIEALITERDALTDEIEQSLHSLEQERQALREQVDAQRISLEEAQHKYADIESKYSAIVANLKLANSKRQEIIDEYRLYRHQERAKIVFPVVVAILAYALSNESGGERVVDGFAGYGAAAALEATGYGLGKPIGRLTFRLTEW